MKKFLSLIISGLITVMSIPCAFAEDTLNLSCPSAILMDSETGKILYEKDSHMQLAPASVTKIMTMLLAMEKIDSNGMKYTDMITGSAHAKEMGGSTIFLDEGESLSVTDILKGIAVASGNDAAVAMAEHIGGSEENFVQMMNKKSKQLGMKNTHFVNCNGLDTDGHYSCAYDIALMSKELMKHKDIFKFTTIWMDSLRGGKFTLSNTNKLIRFYDGATGLKTGSTDKAKFCVSATAKRGNLHLIAVIMAAPTSKDRVKDASQLLNYGFSTFNSATVVKNGETLKKLPIEKADKKSVSIVTAQDFKYIYQKSTPPQIKKEVVIKNQPKAPIKKNSTAGEVVVYNGDKEIGRLPVYYGDNIKKTVPHIMLYKIIKTLYI